MTLNLFDDQSINRLFNYQLFNEENQYFDEEHPFSVILTDVIEAKIEKSEFDHEDLLNRALSIILTAQPKREVSSLIDDEEEKENNNGLKIEKLIAIAYYRSIVKRLVGLII